LKRVALGFRMRPPIARTGPQVAGANPSQLFHSIANLHREILSLAL